MRAILLIGLITSLLFATVSNEFPDFDSKKYNKAKMECTVMVSNLEKEMEEMHMQMSETQRYYSLLTLGFLIGVCMTSKGAFGTTFNPTSYEVLKDYYIELLKVLE